MDERRFLDVISGRARGVAPSAIKTGLSALTPFYRVGIGLRNALFDRRLRHVHQVGTPIVSVGNLTTGGTGKTPMVAWLADWMMADGRRPCIVSRGYRSLDAAGNDERLVLEQLCPDVPHEQDRDRVAAARRAINRYRPDVLILDDGFQHRRLGRNLDLVLIDALNPWGYGRLLPRGLLREPKTSLWRADGVIITRADQVGDSACADLRCEIAKFTQAPIVEVAFRPQRLLAADGRSAELASLANHPVLAFCGIGNPDGFRQTLQSAAIAAASLESFPDHHHYTADDLQRLTARAAGEHASALVTTQKDLVKLRPEWIGDVPVWAIVIGAEATHGRDDLKRMLSSLWG